jgi:hypothetical protein
VITATSAVLKIVGYLRGLSLAFGDGEEHKPQVFAQIVAGGTNKVAHVFEEKEIQIFDAPAVERGAHHVGFEMTDGSGDDLTNGSAGARQPLRVVVRRQISDQRRDAMPAGSHSRPGCARAAPSFPAPGLETRLTTNTPASWNRARSSRAVTSFCFSTFCRTSTSRVVRASFIE